MLLPQQQHMQGYVPYADYHSVPNPANPRDLQLKPRPRTLRPGSFHCGQHIEWGCLHNIHTGSASEAPITGQAPGPARRTARPPGHSTSPTNTPARSANRRSRQRTRTCLCRPGNRSVRTACTSPPRTSPSRSSRSAAPSWCCPAHRTGRPTSRSCRRDGSLVSRSGRCPSDPCRRWS